MLSQRLAKWIFAGNISMFLALVVMVVPGASTQQQPELTVERLNIVDSAGNPALVLANAARLPGATFGHKEYPKSFVGRGRSAGMIFLNEAGDEVGGLIYEGATRDSTYGAFGHLSFDQWKQNQVVAFSMQIMAERDLLASACGIVRQMRRSKSSSSWQSEC